MIDARFRTLTTWPRPRQVDRIWPSFKQTLNQTMDRLETELDKLKATDIVIETAHTASDIRNDGWPRGGAKDPADPGVILSFTSIHGPLRVPCDRFEDWRANLHAIALHLEHLRLASVWGVGQFGEQYKGWARLEAGAPSTDSDAMTVVEATRVLFGLAYPGMRSLDSLGASDVPLVDAYKQIYRRAASYAHPDANGGEQAKWDELQRAKAVLDAHHGIAKNAGGAA